MTADGQHAGAGTDTDAANVAYNARTDASRRHDSKLIASFVDGHVELRDMVAVPRAELAVRDGLALWLDAGSLMYNNNENVKSWPDLSGHGHDAIVASGATAPTFETNGFSNYESVKFPGNGYGLKLANGFNEDGSKGLTVFMALTTLNSHGGSWGGESPIAFANTNGDYGIYAQLNKVDDTTWGPGLQLTSAGRYSRIEQSVAADQFAINVPAVIGMTADPAGSSGGNFNPNCWSVFANGYSPVTFTTNNWNWGHSAGDFAGAGGVGPAAAPPAPRDNSWLGSGWHTGGRIAEVLIYTRPLKNGEVKTIMQYFNAKYGITMAP